MAPFEISDSTKKPCNRKLLIGESVEVRGVDKGLGGSWKTGVVNGEGKLMRSVKLDDVYLKYSTTSRNLIRNFSVSTMIEGDIPASGMPKTYRGLIRPKPPKLDISNTALDYGLCVDVYMDDTWWEGVIFNCRGDLSKERLIFFPDFDVELRVGVVNLRITQDWDEITGDWSPRGYWVFLELIEQRIREIPVDCSARQFWCILKKTDVFKSKIINWNSSLGSMWESVISEVILGMTDNANLPVEVEVRDNSLRKTSSSVISEVILGITDNVNLPDEVEDRDNSLRKTSSPTELMSEDQLEVFTPQQPILQNEGDPTSAESGDCIATENFIFLDDILTEDDLCINDLLNHSFDPNEDLVSEDPNSGSSVPCGDLGIENSRNNEFISWDEFCDDLPFSDSELINFINFDDVVQKCSEDAHEEPQLKYVTHDCNGLDAESFVPAESDILPGADQCPKVCQASTSSSSSSCSESQSLELHEKKIAPLDRKVDIKPMYCPQAVIDWCHLVSGTKRKLCRILSEKVKQHLLAVGWKLEYIPKQATKQEMRYISPRGRKHVSLIRACKEVMEDTLTAEEFKLSSKKSSDDIICTGVKESCVRKKRQSATTAANLGCKNGRPSCDHNVPSQERKKRKPSRSHVEEGKQRNTS